MIVGPTPKPPFNLLRMTLFNKKDLPVRYFPATAITPTRSLIDLRNSTASSVTLKPDRMNCRMDTFSWVVTN